MKLMDRPDIEVIISDGGSYDSTPEVCSRYHVLEGGEIMKKHLFGFLVLAIFVLAGCSSATNSSDSGAAIETEFQYITAEALKTKITANEPLLLIDVRSQEDYDLKHMQESVATGAYPIDTEEKKEKVMAVMDQFKGNTDPIIFLCYKGKTSAENGFKLLQEKGYDAKRLFILEGGMNAWPYDDFLEK